MQISIAKVRLLLKGRQLKLLKLRAVNICLVLHKEPAYELFPYLLGTLVIHTIRSLAFNHLLLYFKLPLDKQFANR